VVGVGDTLRSIAQSAYGDAALWYLIADTNGIASDEQLKVGMELKIPNRITNLHNDYQTFKPYEPSKIIGDTTPTLPDPPPPPAKKKGCGGLALILVIVVAVVVTVITAGAALAVLAPAAGVGAGATAATAGVWAAGTAALSGSVAAGFTGAAMAAAAIGGAVGSIASQLVGMATGIQEKFSWGQVATSAIGAGITSGVGAAFGASGGIAGQMGVPQGVARAAVNGAINNVITQGVNILVGEQKKFDWRGVAAGAVGSAISYSIDTAINGEVNAKGERVGGMDWAKENPATGQFVSRAVGGFASGVARSVIRGGKIDFANIAADAFGNAIGQAIVDAGVASDMQRQLAAAQERARAIRDALQAVQRARFEQMVSDNIDREQAEIGAAMSAMQAAAEAEAARVAPPGASRSPESYLDLEGVLDVLDAPRRASSPLASTPAGDVGAHYYLVGLLAAAFGMDQGEGLARMTRIVAYSQWADQVNALDATTQGARNWSGVFGMQSLGGDESLIGRVLQESIHALNGRSREENIGFFLGLIRDYNNNDAVVGIALHGLVDSVFHTRNDGSGMTFSGPTGHLWEGHDQDYISRAAVQESTRALILAFQHITQREITPRAEQEIWNLVNGALDRAIQRAEVATPPFISGDQTLDGSPIIIPQGPSRHQVELSFRDVVREIFGERGLDFGLRRPEDVPLDNAYVRDINWASTIDETAAYLRSLGLSRVDPRQFAIDGMQAAALIGNRYLDFRDSLGAPVPYFAGRRLELMLPPPPRPVGPPRLR
jgi:hypothetical protein